MKIRLLVGSFVVLASFLMMSCSARGATEPSSTAAVQVATNPARPTLEKTLTPTASLVPTPLPTEVPTPTVVSDYGAWDENEVGLFWTTTGSLLLYDPTFPQDDPTLVLLSEFMKYDEWEGPAEKVSPMEVCGWIYDAFASGYGTKLYKDGVFIEEKTREYRWSEASVYLGDSAKLPYCPQFDANTKPNFDISTD